MVRKRNLRSSSCLAGLPIRNNRLRRLARYFIMKGVVTHKSLRVDFHLRCGIVEFHVELGYRASVLDDLDMLLQVVRFHGAVFQAGLGHEHYAA